MAVEDYLPIFYWDEDEEDRYQEDRFIGRIYEPHKNKCKGFERFISGRNGPFVGCSKYPRCNYSRRLTNLEYAIYGHIQQSFSQMRRKRQKQTTNKRKNKMKWNVSPQDVAKGKLIQKPGWYLAEVSRYAEEENKKKDGTNAVFDFRIISPDDSSANNIEIRVWFSEKAPGIAVPFMKALGAEEKADGTMSVDFGNHLVGKKLQVFVRRGEYDGRPKNEISEYAPIS